MVAPNGARRSKADHPALPVTIAETVETARRCHAEGAEAIHAHVRDRQGRHVLDAGLYRELLGELALVVPGMGVQITTEAVGRYDPEAQRRVVREVRPQAVSVALREMLPDADQTEAARAFYHWAVEADIAVQHILYAADELSELFAAIRSGIVPSNSLQLLFVLGRYADGQQSRLSDIDPFLASLEPLADEIGDVEWAVCAFGQKETDCLVQGVRRGGRARIGFENSLWNRDGSVAADNAERVRELKSIIG